MESCMSCSFPVALDMQSQRILHGSAEDSQPVNVSVERAELKLSSVFMVLSCFVTVQLAGLHVVELCR